jgi:hypothetical protein
MYCWVVGMNIPKMLVNIMPKLIIYCSRVPINNNDNNNYDDNNYDINKDNNDI